MPRIDELYAYIAEDTGPDDEGVAAYWMEGMNVFMPLVGADYYRMASLSGLAKKVRSESGKRIRLVRFKLREDLMEVEL